MRQNTRLTHKHVESQVQAPIFRARRELLDLTNRKGESGASRQTLSCTSRLHSQKKIKWPVDSALPERVNFVSLKHGTSLSPSSAFRRRRSKRVAENCGAARGQCPSRICFRSRRFPLPTFVVSFHCCSPPALFILHGQQELVAYGRIDPVGFRQRPLAPTLQFLRRASPVIVSLRR